MVGGKIAPGAGAREARRQHVPDGSRQARDDDGEPRRRGRDDEKAVIQTHRWRRCTRCSSAASRQGRHKKPEDSPADRAGPRVDRHEGQGARAGRRDRRARRGARRGAHARARSTPTVDLEVYPPSPTLRDVLSPASARVQAPLGLQGHGERGDLGAPRGRSRDRRGRRAARRARAVVPLDDDPDRHRAAGGALRLRAMATWGSCRSRPRAA